MKKLLRPLSLALCLILIISSTLLSAAATGSVTDTKTEEPSTRADEIVTAFLNPNGRILSVAKSGVPRLFPTDSLEGIKACIDMKVDIVSVSVQKTKDGKFVLLESENLSKSCVKATDNTDAEGKVSDYTLKQIQSDFLLKEKSGGNYAKPTKYKVASLEDALNTCKTNIMLMINNGFKYGEEINEVARSLDSCDIVILRGADSADSISKFVNNTGTPICHVAAIYTGNSSGSAKKYVTEAMSAGAQIVELSAEKSYSSIFNNSVLSKFEGKGRAFISTTKPELCGGRMDLLDGWTELTACGYSIIETDYARELANYVTEIEGYRSELSSLISEAQALSTSKYTADSVKSLTNSLKTAEKVAAIGCVSLNDIDEARYNIQESLDNLVVKTGNEKTTLPVWAIVLIVIVSVIALLALIIFGLRLYNKIKNKRKRMDKFKDQFKNRAPEENNTLMSINGEEISLEKDDEDFEEIDVEENESISSADETLSELEAELNSKKEKASKAVDEIENSI